MFWLFFKASTNLVIRVCITQRFICELEGMAVPDYRKKCTHEKGTYMYLLNSPFLADEDVVFTIQHTSLFGSWIHVRRRELKAAERSHLTEAINTA